MNRRKFFGWLAGLVGLGFLRNGKPEEPEGKAVTAWMLVPLSDGRSCYVPLQCEIPVSALRRVWTDDEEAQFFRYLHSEGRFYTSLPKVKKKMAEDNKEIKEWLAQRPR